MNVETPTFSAADLSVSDRCGLIVRQSEGAIKSLLDLLTRIIERYKIVRYGLVSAVVSSISLFLLYALDNWAGWTEWSANLLAVNVGAVPAYVLNRYWVWHKTGRNHLFGEVIPFWVMTIAGMILSTLAVNAAASRWDHSWIPVAANLLSYLSLWVFKFLILDYFVFGRVRPLFAKVPKAEDGR